MKRRLTRRPQLLMVGISQLKKLRGKSLQEFRARGRQGLAIIGERLRASNASEMSDATLFGEFRLESRNGTGEGTAALVIERIRKAFNSIESSKDSLTFFPSLTARDEIVRVATEKFPNECAEIIDRAERALIGRFDLLGFKNLSFGDPIDWHLEPLSGKRAPLDHWSQVDYLNRDAAGDKKITWELNRHQHFVTLGQAYWLTSDERFAVGFLEQASSWMDANPHKRGINWASSLELAFRSISWLWALHFFAESNRLSDEFIARLIKYLVAQGRHIETYLSHYFSPNTHLTGEALALFYLGTALPELNRATGWRATGSRILFEQLPKQIRLDGVYFEQSSYYHRYTIDFYLHLIALARASSFEFPLDVEDRLAFAMDHLMWIARPDGRWPLFGDDDGGQLIGLGNRSANDFRDTLSFGAALFGRGDWKFVAGDSTFETLWLLGPDALARYQEIEPTAPKQTVRAFSSGGYFIMRDGWGGESSYVLVDSGPHGSLSYGHAHADALSFEYASNGTAWLVDPGTFTYTGDAEARDLFRSTEAHNTVTVDGESQSIAAGPFSWKSVARSAAHEFNSEETFAYLEATHDGYKRLSDPVMHSRSVFLAKSDKRVDAWKLPSYVVIRDRFDAKQHHNYSARFHFSPECRAQATGSSLVAADAKGNRLGIDSFGTASAKAQITQGWVSRVYGQKEMSSIGVIEFDGAGPQELVTFLIPQSHDTQTVAQLESPQASGLAFIVGTPESSDIVVSGNGKSIIECKKAKAKGSFAWARFESEEFTRGCLIRGKRFEITGSFALESPTNVRCCAIEKKGRRIEITIHEASRFDLSFSRPQQEVFVNRSRFQLTPDSLSAAFIREGSGWRLINKD